MHDPDSYRSSVAGQTIWLLLCEVFSKTFCYFYALAREFCHEDPPPNENPPIPSVLSHVSVSELYMLYTE